MKGIILTSLVLLLLSCMSGTTITVNQTGLSFDPANIAVQEGDTVVWVWSSSSHTVTNGTGGGDPDAGTLFDATLDNQNPMFSYTFDSTGIYPYFCRPHESFGMLGEVTVNEKLSVADHVTGMSGRFTLHGNYPNPFNPTTTIHYDLPAQSHVLITIYNILGREIRTLINTLQDAGYKSVIWDGTDEFGRNVGTGIYLYQIQAGDFIQTKKMLLLR